MEGAQEAAEEVEVGPEDRVAQRPTGDRVLVGRGAGARRRARPGAFCLSPHYGTFFAG